MNSGTRTEDLLENKGGIRMRSGKSSSIIMLLSFVLCSSTASGVIYEYDKLNRLVMVKYDNGRVIKYTYDTAGNRNRKLTTDASALSDLDDDGDVDGVDLSILAHDLGRTDCPCAGDINGDGVVNESDLSLFSAAFGR